MTQFNFMFRLENIGFKINDVVMDGVMSESSLDGMSCPNDGLRDTPTSYLVPYGKLYEVL